MTRMTCAGFECGLKMKKTTRTQEGEEENGSFFSREGADFCEEKSYGKAFSITKNSKISNLFLGLKNHIFIEDPKPPTPI